MIKTSKLFKKYCLVPDNPEALFHSDSFATTRLDKKGIFIVEYKYGSYGIQYTPVGVAQYALANYNMFLDNGDKKYLASFFRNCNWLKDNLVERGEYCVWYYNFDYSASGYRCKKPWISMMAQGEIISVLIRACSLSNDSNYLNIAERALKSYLIPLSDKGKGGGAPYR